MGADDPRPLRADAERNRRRILDAARAVFAEHGVGAGVDVVAREAGVGVGTIYRRFPTKDDLLRAIVDDRMERLRAGVAEPSQLADPWESFTACATVVAEGMAIDQGFYQALQMVSGTALSVPVCAREMTLELIAPIVARAQLAGVLRDDVVPSDVLSLCAIAAKIPRWRLEHQPELWRRYLAIVFDGLRPAAAHALPHPPADESIVAPLARGGGAAAAAKGA